MSDTIRYYLIQNADLIGDVARLYGFTGDTFWFKIDRAARVVVDEATGNVFAIPEDWNLS